MADKVEIVPYDPGWPVLFFQLGSALREALRPIALRIDRIGSTSISGLAAKPIIDIQLNGGFRCQVFSIRPTCKASFTQNLKPCSPGYPRGMSHP